jgi:benzoyl-CoA reductase/2-hydroxyglutaryl-CoA dehydratase subunit BcrC/BadD/HgdB
MRKVGITTTVPAEIIYSAKAVPVDLNNVFITDDDPNQYVDIAEIDGYPRNLCGWIKGIYGVVIKNDIREVIAVTQGDCSNTHALMETLQLKGVKVIPFAFPYDQDRKMLKLQLERLCEHLGTTWREACLWHKKLHEVKNFFRAQIKDNREKVQATPLKESLCRLYLPLYAYH